jgi:hypothetical protein
MVPLIVGVTALALCCVLPIWTARAVLGGVVALLHRTAPLETGPGSAIQPDTGV